MTTEKNELNLEPALSSEQMKLISATIVKRAFEAIGDVNTYVSKYISANLENMVLAALGIEMLGRKMTSFNGANGFSGSLHKYIVDRAQQCVSERAPGVLAELAQKRFEELMSKDLKRAVTSCYDFAYKSAMRGFLLEHMHVDESNLEQQVKDLIADARKTTESVSKSMMDSYIRSAKGEKINDH
jgi:hypothetical protein